MTVTVASFRATFPEFADTVKYPDASAQFWLSLAVVRLNALRWADSLDFGTMLFMAHQLGLGARNMKSAGGILAPMKGKTVDKVSVQLDTAAVTFTDAGHWNGTNYGIQFYELLMMVGAGVVQL